MRTSRKACFMSPHSATGKNLLLTSTLHSRFCNAVPVSKHSLNEGIEQIDLAEASCTIRIFVLSVFYLVYVKYDSLYHLLGFFLFDDSFCELIFVWCFHTVQIYRGPSSVFQRDSSNVIGFQLYSCLDLDD